MCGLPSIPLSDRCDLPAIPAVYLAYAETDGVLYVGLTRSLRSRWGGRSHHQLSRLEKFMGVRLAWVPANAEELASLETVMVQRHHPLLNGVRVGADIGQVQSALKLAHGNVSKAARAYGMTRQGLWLFLQRKKLLGGTRRRALKGTRPMTRMAFCTTRQHKEMLLRSAEQAGLSLSAYCVRKLEEHISAVEAAKRKAG